MSEFFIDKILEIIEDYEDVKLAEERLKNLDNKKWTLKEAAKECDFDYDNL